VGPGQASTIRRLRAAREAALDACAARDRFNAIAAHELRQPLAALTMQADLLRRLGIQRGDAQLQELGEDMRSSLHRQARLVEDLLDVHRVRTGTLRLETAWVDLGPLVARVAAAMAATVPTVRLRLDVPAAGVLRCRADPVRTEQIVSNLVENALKFAGSCGTVEVRVAEVGDHVRIVVSDTGRGITPGSGERLFEMFSRQEDPAFDDGAGMGIGLAVVHEIATAHGGRVRVHSDGIGLGAEFTVWLPLAGTPRTTGPSLARRPAAENVPAPACAAASGRRRPKQRGASTVRTSL
jgi:two-component system CheB/CheR fusion protein